MNIEQYNHELPAIPPDTRIDCIQARIIKRSHPGKTSCDLCFFKHQEHICSLLIDSCNSLHYELIRYC